MMPSTFQSALPARGATCARSTSRWRSCSFQSALPARGATRGLLDVDQPDIVSIRAPRAGSDAIVAGLRQAGLRFNPRSPRGERRFVRVEMNRSDMFQSALPARGATSRRAPPCRASARFNPRSPRGERRARAAVAAMPAGVSIRAPRAGSDGARGAPCVPRHVSIRAPRAGSDSDPEQPGEDHGVSIRAPRAGSDLTALRERETLRMFQSALPARGATARASAWAS